MNKTILVGTIMIIALISSVMAIDLPLNGHLKISSVPTGANIYINGVSYGTTPDLINLAPGKYTVKVTMEGYQDFTKTVTIKSNRTTTLKANLKEIVPEPEQESTPTPVSKPSQSNSGGGSCYCGKDKTIKFGEVEITSREDGWGYGVPFRYVSPEYGFKFYSYRQIRQIEVIPSERIYVLNVIHFKELYSPKETLGKSLLSVELLSTMKSGQYKMLIALPKDKTMKGADFVFDTGEKIEFEEVPNNNKRDKNNYYRITLEHPGVFTAYTALEEMCAIESSIVNQ